MQIAEADKKPTREQIVGWTGWGFLVRIHETTSPLKKQEEPEKPAQKTTQVPADEE